MEWKKDMEGKGQELQKTIDRRALPREWVTALIVDHIPRSQGAGRCHLSPAGFQCCRVPAMNVRVILPQSGWHRGHAGLLRCWHWVCGDRPQTLSMFRCLQQGTVRDQPDWRPHSEPLDLEWDEATWLNFWTLFPKWQGGAKGLFFHVRCELNFVCPARLG